MGAATALLYSHKDPSIAGMVLDSPFSKLTQLAEELVKSNSKIPKFLVSMAMMAVRSSISSKAKFDIYDLNPIKKVDQSFIPVLFLAGDNDNFVGCHHTQAIYDKYAGDKEIELFRGDHNSPRPEDVMFKVGVFFNRTMQCDLIQERLAEIRNEDCEEEEEQINGDEEFIESQQFQKYKEKNLVMGIDEEEEMRLAILASIEMTKHELVKQMEREEQEEEKRI